MVNDEWLMPYGRKEERRNEGMKKWRNGEMKK
jgi:hypothetical protein